MTPDTVGCEACGRSYRIDERYWGRSFECSCGEVVNVQPPPGKPLPDAFGLPVRRAESSGMATAVFVLGLVGLLGFILCGLLLLLSPIAWILGHRERRRRREQGLPPIGLLTAGWVMGIIGTVLLVLGILVFVVFFSVLESSL